jgi:hypothetical protein
MDPPAPHRTAPFLLGLLAGCLVGAAGLWAALWFGGALSSGEDEQAKEEAEKQAKKVEVARQAAESARAEAVQSLEEAKLRMAAALKQKEDALARLAEEQARRAALEKSAGGAGQPPAQSFVRDWQLLGPFAGTAERAHDTIYPPEREAIQLQKAYAGFGGVVRWRPYKSAEDKIDLAEFFNYRQAGVAYAVSWVFSDEDRAVTLGVGSDDGVRVWVNRQQVHDVKGGRQARPGQDLVKARLKKGWNELRAKVDNIVGTWELYLELRSADGGEPLKLLSSNTPPPRGVAR